MGYAWDFSFFVPYADAFLKGALVTLELSLLASFVGTIAGVPLATALRLPIVGPPLVILNDMVRAVPMLVLMFFAYYFPYSGFLGIAPPSAFWCAVGAMVLAQAVYTADIVRGALAQPPRGSLLAAHAIGLKRVDIWRYVLLPDIARQTLPTLVAFYIGNVRLSSLASVIGTQEVVYTAERAIGQRARSFEAWLIVAAIYIALVLPMSYAARKLEESAWLKRL